MEFLGKVINGKYLLQKIISADRCCTRYEAFDAATNSVVEATIISPSVMSRRSGDIIRFKNIAAKISAIPYPAIMHILEAGEFFDRAYVITESGKKTALAGMIATGEIATMPIAQKVYIAKCVAEALNQSHRHGILHRAISPAFVFIAGQQVLLGGFGFAHILEYPDDFPEEELEEMLGYLPPEQRGIIRRPIDERSDLYSTGALLYRLLTGTLPFVHTRNGASASVRDTLISPQTINSAISDILEAIVWRLLAKEPSERYQSASGLVHDLELFLSGNTHFSIGQKDGMARLNYRVPLVGRKKEMARLMNIFSEAKNGSGKSVAILGSAGCGKSRLIEEFREHAEQCDAVFIEAKCHRESAHTPYEALSMIFDSLIRYYQSVGEHKKHAIAETIENGTPSFRQLLAKVYPGISKIFSDNADLKTELVGDNAQKSIIIARFLCSLETIGSALILCIDDIQWIDQGSMSVVKELSGMLEHSRVMLLSTAREGDGFLEKEKRGDGEFFVSETIRLPSLDESSMRELVAHMLSEKEEHVSALADIIFRKSAGSPLFAISIIRNIIESKALLFDESAWKCDAYVAMMDIPLSLVDLVAESVSALQENEKELIACAAVIGKAFNFKLISHIVDMPQEEIISAIDRARSLHIFKESFSSRDTIQFSHDRILEIFLEQIAPERRRYLHSQIAHAIQSLGVDNDAMIFDLAHHVYEAGDFEKAALYLMPAARKARDNYAYRDAAQLYKKAITALEKSGGEKRNEINECKLELASVDVIIGEYEEAIALLADLLPHLEKQNETNIEKKSRAHLILCNAFYRKADWKNCEAQAAAGLAMLGDSIPHGILQTLWYLIKELTVYLLNMVLPFRVRKKAGPRAEYYRKIIEFFEPLAMSYALNDPAKLVWSNIHILNISTRHIGPSPELAMSYYAVGALYMSIPLFGIAETYLRKALRMNEDLGVRWGLAKTLELFGYFYEWQAKFQEAEHFYEQAKRIFHELGDVKEYAMALNGLEHCAYYTGNYSRALEINKEYYALVKRIGDEYSIGAALIYFSQYYRERGNLDEAIHYAQEAYKLSRDRGIWFNYCSALNELGCNLLESGFPSRAIAYLEEAKSLHEKSTFLKQYVLPVYVNLAQAYIDEYHLSASLSAPDENKRLVRKIFGLCREAMRKTRRWPTHHSGAIRVYAVCLSIQGKNRKARAMFEQSKKISREHRRMFEELRAIVECGNHHLRCGDTAESRTCFEEAYRLSMEIGAELYCARLSKLLGIHERDEKTPIERHLGKERHVMLAQQARDILLIADEKTLFDAILTAAMDFMGARSGCLFDENAQSICFKGMENARVQQMQQVLASHLKREKEIYTIDRDMRHQMAFPVFTSREQLGICIIENPFLEQGFSAKDIPAVVSFLEIVSQALSRLRSTEIVDIPSKEAISSATKQKVAKAIEYIQKNYTSDISREGLAASLDINPDHLGKAFKVITGEKIGDFINRLRIEEAAKRLAEGKEKIIDIAYGVGFESLSTFNRSFAKIMEVSPQDYRKRKMK